MQKIDDIFWITGRGAIVIIERKDTYTVGDEVEIVLDDKQVGIYTISGIEGSTILTYPTKLSKSIGLLLRGLTQEDWVNKKICPDMLIRNLKTI